MPYLEKESWVALYADESGQRRKRRGFETRELAEAFEAPRKRARAAVVEAERQRRALAEREKAEETRRRNLVVNGDNSSLEAKAMVWLVSALGRRWECRPVRDGAHTDFAVRMRSHEDSSPALWHGIQVKATATRGGGGSRTAKFQIARRYDDAVVLCVLMDEGKVWAFHGRELEGGDIGIGRVSPKYGENEVEARRLSAVLGDMLAGYRPRPIEELDVQNLCNFGYLEHVAHLAWRAQPTRPGIRAKKIGDVENSVVDYCEVDGRRVQEKTCAVFEGRPGFVVQLCRKGGRIGGRRTRVPYADGEVDLFRILLLAGPEGGFNRSISNVTPEREARAELDALRLAGYWEIPASELAARGYLTTAAAYGKTRLYVYPTASFCTRHGWREPQHSNAKTWTRAFFREVGV